MGLDVAREKSSGLLAQASDAPSWTKFGSVRRRAQVLPRAKFVLFFPFDKSWVSLDLQGAWHPQTLIA
jgi:hypothetical protein